jgi:hypothetical protein
MNYYNYQRFSRPNMNFIRPRLLKGAIREIIIANVAVFLVMAILRIQQFVTFNFGLVPHDVLTRGYLWQLLPICSCTADSGICSGTCSCSGCSAWKLELLGSAGILQILLYYRCWFRLITLLFSAGSQIRCGRQRGDLRSFTGICDAFSKPPDLFYFLIPIKAKYFVAIMVVITFFSTLHRAPAISVTLHTLVVCDRLPLSSRFKFFAYVRRQTRSANWHWPRLKIRNLFSPPAIQAAP